MASALKYIGQAVAYALFAGVVGYFSTSPAYTHLEPGLAVIKLSFSHAAQHKGECRRLSSEEIAALPPNMRRPLDCPRERLPVVVELVLDGKVLYQDSLAPSGVAGDGASTAYMKFPVEAGAHHLVARLRDSDRPDGYDYEKEADIRLHERESLVIDFRPAQGGFLFL
ncbi:MAG: hypothetical protein PVF91_10145 [Chromatiales bacterium]|jgi:hypothetical protein